MTKSLSFDLRKRVIAAIQAGSSCREAAKRFDIAAATAIRWHQRWVRHGSFEAQKRGGYHGSPPLEAHAQTILLLHRERADITLREIQEALDEQGFKASIGAIFNFFRRRNLTHKKRLSMPASRSGTMLCNNERNGPNF